MMALIRIHVDANEDLDHVLERGEIVIDLEDPRS